MKLIVLFFNHCFCDSPKSWQCGFQDPATEFIEGIIDLHHDVFSYLVFIGFFVLILFLDTVWLFNTKNNFLFSLDNRHNSILEIIWTSIPALILLLIATPSFALIYAMDEAGIPQLTIKVVGNQWYWNYEYSNCVYIDFDESNGIELEELQNSFSYWRYLKELFYKEETKPSVKTTLSSKNILYRPFGLPLDFINIFFEFDVKDVLFWNPQLWWVNYLYLTQNHAFGVFEYLYSREKDLWDFWMTFRYMSHSLYIPMYLNISAFEKLTDFSLQQDMNLYLYGLLMGQYSWDFTNASFVLENRALSLHWLLANYKRFFNLLRYENQPNFFSSFKNIYLSNLFVLFFNYDKLTNEFFQNNAFLYNICSQFTMYDSYYLWNWLSDFNSSRFVKKTLINNFDAWSIREVNHSTLDYIQGRLPWWSGHLTKGASFDTFLATFAKFWTYPYFIEQITEDGYVSSVLALLTYRSFSWYVTSDHVDFYLRQNVLSRKYDTYIEEVVPVLLNDSISIDWIIDYIFGVTKGVIFKPLGHNFEDVSVSTPVSFFVFDFTYGCHLKFCETAWEYLDWLRFMEKVVEANKTFTYSSLNWDYLVTILVTSYERYHKYIIDYYRGYEFYSKLGFGTQLDFFTWEKEWESEFTFWFCEGESLYNFLEWTIGMRFFDLFSFRLDIETSLINVLTALTLQKHFINDEILNTVCSFFQNSRNLDSDLRLFFWGFKGYRESLYDPEVFNSSLYFLPYYFFKIYYNYGVLEKSATMFPGYIDYMNINSCVFEVLSNNFMVHYLSLLKLHTQLDSDVLLKDYNKVSGGYFFLGQFYNYIYPTEIFRCYSFLSDFRYFYFLFGKNTTNYLTVFSENCIGDLGWFYNVKKFASYFLHINYESRMLETEDILNFTYGPSIRLLSVDKPLLLPIDINVRFLITSNDVLHSWTVPSFGLKLDACPGRMNQVSVFLKRSGSFYGQCSELCGVNHGFMPIEVIGLSVLDFLDWFKRFF